MDSPALVLVGDRFESFGALDGAITVSTMARILEKSNVDPERLPTQLVLGQGVSESWWLHLRQLAEERGIPQLFRSDIPIFKRAGRRVCHKALRRNVLVTEPEKIDDDLFAMELIIDDENEIMTDHVTGHHIQGMLLIEASRQAFIAVTEKYVVSGTQEFYYVLSSIDSHFLHFAFPVATKLLLRINKIDATREDKLKISTDIEFHQNGKIVCKISINYMATLAENIAAKEKRLAVEALQSGCKYEYRQVALA